MVIVIGGMIGTGKTTLAELLKEEFKSELFLEDVKNSEILPLFYTATEQEIQEKRYPFLLQLEFLNNRFKMIKEALINRNNILDRSIYEDLYFCECNYKLGRISETEFKLYKGLLNNMLEEIQGMPKKSPDIMIYLTGSFETIIKRIFERGRTFETDTKLIEYYKYLWKGYDNWIYKNYKASEIMEFSVDYCDFKKDHKLTKSVANAIRYRLDALANEQK